MKIYNFLFYILNINIVHSYIKHNIKMMKVSDYIIKRLEKEEIKHVFSYTGGSNLPLFNSLYNSNIKPIINKNEQYCAYSATGYAKASNKIGFLMTTSGPGITNTITGIQDAYSDGIPLLVISGQVNSNVLNTDAFQECNAIAITKSCTKYNKLIMNKYICIEELEKALKICKTPRFGPVHLDICKNILEENIEEDEINKILFQEDDIEENYINSLYNNHKIRGIYQNYENIESLVNKMIKAKSPIIIAGAGTKMCYEDLRKFAIKNKIPVTTTLHGLGVFDENHQLSLNMCGMHGSVYSNMLIQNADLIIGIGYRFDDRTIGNINKYAPNAKSSSGIYHIDNSDDKLEKVRKIFPTIRQIKMDCKDFLQIMNKKFISIDMDRNEYLNYILKLKRDYSLNKYISNKFLNIPTIISELSNQLKDKKYYITTGVGSHQMNVAQHFKYNRPNTLLTSGSLGVMGVGIPYAIGAQLSDDTTQVYCIDGDGSIMMSLSDLSTIKEYNLPIKILIMDNNALQMVSTWQEMFYDKRYIGVNMNDINFCKIGEAFGIKSIYIDDIKKLKSSIKEIIESKESILAHFKVRQERCLPFVPPKNGLDEIIY